MQKKNNEILFAALKFIEALHHEGHIPAYMFKNILNEHSEKVDISRFEIKINAMKGEKNVPNNNTNADGS